MSRMDDVHAARAAADEWAEQRGLPASGGYSGDWYVNAYLGQQWPDDWLKWWANYGVPAGGLMGGAVVMHQFTSTPVDQDMMLESEIVATDQPSPPPADNAQRETPEDWDWPTWYEAAVNLKAIADQLGQERDDAVAKIQKAQEALA
jgi:hypothetical protein